MIRSRSQMHPDTRLMNILVALESKRVEVAMEVREVREVSSTWRLREHGGVFGRM